MSELTALPAQFGAGTTVTYRRSYSDYPASAGWVLTLMLRGAAGLDVEASADGDDFVVTLAAEKTATLTAGGYQYVERLTKAGVVVDMPVGQVLVTPDFATSENGELQSFAERVVAALEARLLGRITKDQESLQLDGTSIVRIPFGEIAGQLAKWKNILAAERRGSQPLGVTKIAFTRIS